MARARKSAHAWGTVSRMRTPVARDLEAQEGRSLVEMDDVHLSPQGPAEREFHRPPGRRRLVPEPHPDVDIASGLFHAPGQRTEDHEQLDLGQGLRGLAKRLGN